MNWRIEHFKGNLLKSKLEEAEKIRIKQEAEIKDE